MNRHKPSVDALFRSAVKDAGMNMMAILMTGMGSDGAEGLARLKKRGAITVAQDEKSSAIFGMPKAAIELGGAQLVLSLESIPLAISAFCQGTQLPVR
jgi:two-component system chemotaxis response regulator CheB